MKRFLRRISLPLALVAATAVGGCYYPYGYGYGDPYGYGYGYGYGYPAYVGTGVIVGGWGGYGWRPGWGGGWGWRGGYGGWRGGYGGFRGGAFHGPAHFGGNPGSFHR